MPKDPILTEQEILEELQSIPGWKLRDNWISYEYKSPGFAHNMMLAQTIGFLSEAANHHPDLKIGYAQLTVKLQSHREGGITARDIALAKKIHDVITWQPSESSPLDGYPKIWVH